MDAIFTKLKEHIDAFDATREQVIKQSRDVLKLSKRAIYAVHRGDLQGAEQLLAEARAAKQHIEGLEAEARIGSFTSACEEYVEACAFMAFSKREELPAPEELGVQPEEYLGGLADLCGELARRAVLAATERKREEVDRIHTLIEELYGHFVAFDFRNGELRRKYDSIKYHLQKVEEVRYELEVRHGRD